MVYGGFYLWNGGEVASSFSPVARQVKYMGCVWSPDDDDDDDVDDDDGDDGDDDNSDDDDDYLLVMTEALLGAQRGNWKTIKTVLPS